MKMWDGLNYIINFEILINVMDPSMSWSLNGVLRKCFFVNFYLHNYVRENHEH